MTARQALGEASKAVLKETLAAALAALPGVFATAPRIVACSGGRDSMLLLRLLADHHRETGLTPPQVLHVHHGLDPAADRWADAVRRAAEACGAASVVRRVRVEAARHGPEDAARRARHAAFADALSEPAVLLLAHHGDDQAETHLLRLLRGAGPGGLAAMAASRPLAAGLLLRPWLEVPGADVEAAARSLGLAWEEDPDNRDVRSDRVFLRRTILPQLEARWPGARAALRRSARAAADDAAALAAALPPLAEPGAPLPLAALAGDAATQRALLRAWLAQAGLPAPSARRLEALRGLAGAAEDAAPVVDVAGAQVRRHDGALHLLTAALPEPRETTLAAAPGVLELDVGRLELRAQTGPGIRADGATLQVRFARGGERLALPRRPTRPLKRLFQEARVPPWWRQRTPLLYRGDELVAVAGLGIGRSAVVDGDETLSLTWHPRDLGVGAPGEVPPGASG